MSDMQQSSGPSINNAAATEIVRGQPVSLKALFQVVTCCCMFFAVLRFSPTAALILTVVFAPALIRTAYVAEHCRRRNEPLDLKQRLLAFSNALGVVLLTLGGGGLAFLGISIAFGLLGMLFGFAVARTDFLFEAGIIGTVGGMIWGIAGAFLTVVFMLLRFWNQSALDG